MIVVLDAHSTVSQHDNLDCDGQTRIASRVDAQVIILTGVGTISSTALMRRE